MRYVLSTTFTLLMVALTSSAVASQGPYIGLKGGQSQLRDLSYSTNGGRINNSYSSGRTGSVVFGGASAYQNDFRSRVELEFGQQSGSISSNNRSGDTRARFGFLNFYGDSRLAEGLDFIFGAGLGVAEVSFDDHRSGLLNARLDDQDVSFGYQVNTGLAATLSERLTLEAGYRFQSWEDVRVHTSDGRRNDLRVSSHNLQLGLRLSL